MALKPDDEDTDFFRHKLLLNILCMT